MILEGVIIALFSPLVVDTGMLDSQLVEILNAGFYYPYLVGVISSILGILLIVLGVELRSLKVPAWIISLLLHGFLTLTILPNIYTYIMTLQIIGLLITYPGVILYLLWKRSVFLNYKQYFGDSKVTKQHEYQFQR